MNARIYAAVFAGGCVGGAARMGIDLAFDSPAWPWEIVAVNVLGSALLGALMGRFAHRTAPWWLPALGPGFLGGFTTFSALAAPHDDARAGWIWALVLTLVLAPVAAGLARAAVISGAPRRASHA